MYPCGRGGLLVPAIAAPHFALEVRGCEADHVFTTSHESFVGAWIKSVSNKFCHPQGFDRLDPWGVEIPAAGSRERVRAPYQG